MPDLTLPSADPPSSEVDKLRAELAKTQDMYQSACSAAREAKLRAERAEEQLDSKPRHGFADWEGLEKELEKRLVSVTTQLEEARRNPNNSDASKLQLIRENDSLKIELISLRNKEEAANRWINDFEAYNIALAVKLEIPDIAAEAPAREEGDLEAYNIALKVELDDAGITEEALRITEGDFEASNIAIKEELEDDWIAEAPTRGEGDLSDEVAVLKQELDSLRNSEQFERSLKVDLINENNALKQELNSLRKSEQ
ncbi:hypothetical protein PRIPAC_86896 [Pristionchus pacificus]|nr:hypothetical protein PRIPAC_86896 [Pristionchus pacificus]